MTLEEFNRLLETAGYPVAFRNFPKEEPHEPPFVCYITLPSENFSADGKVYYSDQRVQVELYTLDRDEEAMTKVEKALENFYYEKDEGYIDSERIYMTTYQLTL